MVKRVKQEKLYKEKRKMRNGAIWKRGKRKKKKTERGKEDNVKIGKE